MSTEIPCKCIKGENNILTIHIIKCSSKHKPITAENNSIPVKNQLETKKTKDTYNVTNEELVGHHEGNIKTDSGDSDLKNAKPVEKRAQTSDSLTGPSLKNEQTKNNSIPVKNKLEIKKTKDTYNDTNEELVGQHEGNIKTDSEDSDLKNAKPVEKTAQTSNSLIGPSLKNEQTENNSIPVKNQLEIKKTKDTYNDTNEELVGQHEGNIKTDPGDFNLKNAKPVEKTAQTSDSLIGPSLKNEQTENEKELPTKNADETRFLDSLIVDSEDQPTQKPKKVLFKETAVGEYPQKSPEQSELKLPVLPHRFHGPGCAMEIAILEKHQTKCKFRKKMNADRNSNEDRIGSYETIGRLVFRTCQDSTPDLVLDKIRKTPTFTFFSFLKNIPGESNDVSNMDLRESKSDVFPKIADHIMKKQEILDSLVESSKSFTMGERLENTKCDQCFECSCSNCSCEGIHELFWNYSNLDTSTQTTDMEFVDLRQFFKTKITRGIIETIRKIKMKSQKFSPIAIKKYLNRYRLFK